MKTNFMKVSTWAMALCASMAVFTACNDDENGTTPPPAPSVENLGGIVTENMTLTANTEYKLTSQLQVKAPAVLTIEEGVKITAADSEDPIYILIEQGAKINAVGTVENPIVKIRLPVVGAVCTSAVMLPPMRVRDFLKSVMPLMAAMMPMIIPVC